MSSKQERLTSRKGNYSGFSGKAGSTIIVFVKSKVRLLQFERFEKLAVWTALSMDYFRTLHRVPGDLALDEIWQMSFGWSNTVFAQR